MAAGVPVVCSPVGVNVEVVADGINGYLARNDDEWVAHTEELLCDETLCDRFARAGKDTIAQRYSVATVLDRFVDILAGATFDVMRQEKSFADDADGRRSSR
jgi:glycosyltransferase involved in cell wall biosynthesis